MPKREIILDDFGKRDSEHISELVYEALINLGYEEISSFNWEIKVNIDIAVAA
tara:strand:+ start:360 stop:518 length:159 start_codon:yes stop_codon:yes gene_type:complete